MARRSGLGRGLESLIPLVQPEEGTSYRQVPLDAISPNPHQPRALFDEEALESLTASIMEVGVLQPVVVRPGVEEGTFILIAGERRWRAARRAGLGEVPAIVRTPDEQGSLTEALIENLQRENLSPLEEAAAYQQLMEDFGMTHEQIGTRVGKSRAAVSNTLRLLSLPASIQGLLERGELSAGAARALLGLEDARYAEHVARRAAAEGWSVRQVEEAARLRRDDRPRPSTTVTTVRPPALIELEQRLQEKLGSKVQIQYRNERGKVVIHFQSPEDLERIYRSFFS